MNEASVQQFERLMIIVWRWRDPDSDDRLQEVDYGEWGVWEPVWEIEEDKKAGIIRIDPCLMKEEPYDPQGTPRTALEKSIRDIEFLLSHRTNLEQKTQVYLHTTHTYSAEHKNDLLAIVKKLGCTCEVNTFQFKDSALYISPKSPFGLLGEDGSWGKTVDKDKLHYAKKSDHLITKDHFDFVWEFFQRLPKEKTYDLCESVLLTLQPLVYNEAVTSLEEYTRQVKNIEEKISVYLANFSADARFYDFCATLTTLQLALKNDDREHLKGLLQQVRQDSIKLLNTLPGNHIYA